VPPPVYVVIRRTTDWADEAAVRAQLPPAFVPLVELWNDTFDLPYHRFRQRLKEIAIANHARVEGAICAALADVPRGALIAPVDDDDWFAPTMAQHVVAACAEEPYRGYRWRSRFLEVPPDFGQWRGAWRRRLWPNAPLRWVCTTNNYVIANIGEVAPLVASHVKASAWFTEHAARVRVLDLPLSLQNRNLASQTTLRPLRGTMTRAKLIRRQRQYRRLYARAARREPEWARAAIVALAELTTSLRVRRR
jgi:hypothetical protein